MYNIVCLSQYKGFSTVFFDLTQCGNSSADQLPLARCERQRACHTLLLFLLLLFLCYYCCY